MDKKKVMYIGIILLVTVITSITYFSYAFFTKKDEYHGRLNIVAGELKYKIESTDLVNNSITIPANTNMEIEIEISSLNDIGSEYSLFYDNDDVEIGYKEDTTDLPSGSINSTGRKRVTLILKNSTNSAQTVTFGVKGGFSGKTVSFSNSENPVDEVLSMCVATGTEWEFTYTGSYQTFTAPCIGKYKLEVWGAQGGSVDGMVHYDGAKGGYSYGEKILDENDTLYLTVGDEGASIGNNAAVLNSGTGYNGGGRKATQSTTQYYGSGGGGATHIATQLRGTGTLSEYNSYRSDLLLVAGGGGGSSTSSTSINNVGTNGAGGAGGGTNGSGGNTTYTGSDTRTPGGGGSQSAAGGTYSNVSTYTAASFGQGCMPYATYDRYMRVAGGGGYFGGGCGIHSGGGGGSGYVSSALSNSGTQNGVGAGSGKIKITYLGEVNLRTLYSAASDQLYYYDGDNNRVNIGTTDTTGKLENANVSQGMTIYSSIAKKIDTEGYSSTNPFTKTLTAADLSHNEIKIMPSGFVVYWYGYKYNDFSNIKSVNGSRNTYTYTSSMVPQFETNRVKINYPASSSGARTFAGRYASAPIDVSNYSKIHIHTSSSAGVDNAINTELTVSDPIYPAIEAQQYVDNSQAQLFCGMTRLYNISTNVWAKIGESVFEDFNKKVVYQTSYGAWTCYIHAYWFD